MTEELVKKKRVRAGHRASVSRMVKKAHMESEPGSFPFIMLGRKAKGWPEDGCPNHITKFITC